MPRKYIYTDLSLDTWKTYLKNPALLGRRPKLWSILRSEEILALHSRRGRCPAAELLGLLRALSEVMPRQKHFRTAYRLSFFNRTKTHFRSQAF